MVSFKFIARTARRFINGIMNLGNLPEDARDNVIGQKLLLHKYSFMQAGQRLPFRDVGFSIYSQHDEDGILLYLLARIGFETYRSVEICAGNGIECNTANLLLNHRYTGLLIDGSPSNIATARAFYQSRKETMYWPPDIVESWLTRDNINEVISKAGYEGTIDLLSLDVDGMDYWFWKELNVVSPRLVVLEYNHLLGPMASLTVPYSPNFVAEFSEYGSDYAGASLRAFVNLGRQKGYRFVGTNTIGTNAFFVRNDIPSELVPEAAIEDAFKHPRAKFGMTVRYEKIKHKAWVDAE